MADVHEFQTASSKESEIERRLDALAAKMVSEAGTRQDWAEYQELLASRARLMRPPVLSRRLYA